MEKELKAIKVTLERIETKLDAITGLLKPKIVDEILFRGENNNR